MNILLINHYAGSNKHGMEYRPYYLAKEWTRLGHQVTIIASSISHLHNKRPVVTGNYTKDIIEGINYFWLKTPEYQGNGMRRVINMLAFSWLLCKYKKKIIKECQPDVIIASSPHPFIIYGAAKISDIAKAKLIFEVRDLWPLTLVELGGISTRHPFIQLMQWTENYAYRRADRVVSLLPKAQSYMQEHGMQTKKFKYIPNGIDIGEWQENTKPIPLIYQELLNGLKDKRKFVIGYTGTHGIANALDYLIDAAVLLKDTPVTFILVGEGPEKGNLQKKVNQLELTNVIFLDPIEKRSIPSLLAAMDALYIGWRKEPLYRFGVSPNKLIDYMMAGKPVIHSIEAGNDLVKESTCGFSTPPEDPRAIAQAIKSLMTLNSQELEEIGLKGKEYVKANHDYRVLGINFLGGL